MKSVKFFKNVPCLISVALSASFANPCFIWYIDAFAFNGFQNKLYCIIQISSIKTNSLFSQYLGVYDIPYILIPRTLPLTKAWIWSACFSDHIKVDIENKSGHTIKLTLKTLSNRKSDYLNLVGEAVLWFWCKFRFNLDNSGKILP